MLESHGEANTISQYVAISANDKGQEWQHAGSLESQVEANTISHYVAINAAVSFAQGEDKMRVFAPDNCSVTSFDNSSGKLVIVDLGITADTFVN